MIQIIFVKHIKWNKNKTYFLLKLILLKYLLMIFKLSKLILPKFYTKNLKIKFSLKLSI